MALAHILPRFDVEANPKNSLATVFSARTAEQARAQALAEAEQRGLEKGLAAARAELDAKMAEERGSFEQRLLAERARWIEEEAGPLMMTTSPLLPSFSAM